MIQVLTRSRVGYEGVVDLLNRFIDLRRITRDALDIFNEEKFPLPLKQPPQV